MVIYFQICISIFFFHGMHYCNCIGLPVSPRSIYEHKAVMDWHRQDKKQMLINIPSRGFSSDDQASSWFLKNIPCFCWYNRLYHKISVARYRYWYTPPLNCTSRFLWWFRKQNKNKTQNNDFCTWILVRFDVRLFNNVIIRRSFFQ